MNARSIDWAGIHARLAAATTALSAGCDSDPDEVRRVLQARARGAARPPAKADDVERLQVLAFTLAGETYAIETRYVREVCQLKDLTALPGTPPFLAGVMNLRGRVVAIVDLRRFFELPSRGLTELNRVIVLYDGANELGLLADSIDEVTRLAANDLQPGLPTLTGLRERFLMGLTGQTRAVLDGGRLLTDASLKVNGGET
jgi:purine-binding chemotaxis protein CheW